MELTLDFPFIRNILEQEHARARDEIRDLRVLRALESSRQRHGARIAAAPDVGALACRADDVSFTRPAPSRAATITRRI
jgi:hypothetical protein